MKAPEYRVPAKGLVEWMNVTVPLGFAKDTWVTSMEIKPSAVAVTHHICVFFRPRSPDTVYNTFEWIDRPRDDKGNEIARPKGSFQRFALNLKPGAKPIFPGNIEGCYVPGGGAEDYRPFQAGKLIPANADVMFSVHYTPNGTETVDQTAIGFTVASEPPQRQYVSMNAGVPTDSVSFAIPPNDSNWQSPISETTFAENAELVWMMPHMHLRRKDMTFRVESADAKSEIILSVPRYDFNWQLSYNPAQPTKLPKGAKLYVVAHYDNSANNKFNPDPNQTVYYGDMTWEEMMVGFYGVVVDKNVDPKKIVKRRTGGPVDGA